MSTDHPAIANLERCWDSLDPFLGSLDAGQWQTPSLCPDWTVLGVVRHLGAVEHMLAGQAPDSMAERLPFEKAGEFMQETEQLGPEAVLERYRSVLERRRADLDRLHDADLDAPCMTPVGPGTYGRFMAVRVFDFWVHEQDVRVPLDRPGHRDGPAAEMAIDEIEGSLGYIVGKKVGLADGKAMTIELTGPVERTMHVAVDGRARSVETLADPDVTLTADSLTFALLACGRIDPQRAIDDGAITWTGDATIGEHGARSLAFTM